MLKKTLSLLLAIVVVFGLTATAFAAPPATSDRVTDIVLPIDYHAVGKYNPDSITPGTVWIFPLTADMFTWKSGNSYGKEVVTSAQLTNVTLDGRKQSNASAVTYSLIHGKVAGGSGLRTSYVEVKFPEEWDKATAQKMDFEIYLRLNRNIKNDSRVTISGNFENDVHYVDGGIDIYSMSKGMVVEATEYIASIDLELCEGLIFTTRMFANRRYMGYADADITEADEPTIAKFNDNFLEIYHVKVGNLTTTGTPITIENYPDCFAYDKNGKYLGSTNGKLPYSETYVITERRTDGSSSGSTDSGSTTGSGSSGVLEPVAPTAPATLPSNATTLTDDTLANLTTAAINTAKGNGSSTATVRVLNNKSVSANALKAMVKSASAAGMSALLNADTMNGNAIAGRLTVISGNVGSLSSNITLGVFPDSATTAPVASKFNKYYRNDMRFLTLEHAGSYGMTVNIAAKLDMGGMKTTNLHVYSYDRKLNQFRLINGAGAFVDKNGFFQFKTTYGDDIIISDGPLARK